MPNTDAVLGLAHACIAEGQRRLGARLATSTKTNGHDASGDRKEEKKEEEQDSSSSSSSSSVILVPADLRSSEDGGAQHLSLSRTLYLRSHHIDPFVADLRKALAWATR